MVERGVRGSRFALRLNFSNPRTTGSDLRSFSGESEITFRLADASQMSKTSDGRGMKGVSASFRPSIPEPVIGGSKFFQCCHAQIEYHQDQRARRKSIPSNSSHFYHRKPLTASVSFCRVERQLSDTFGLPPSRDALPLRAHSGAASLKHRHERCHSCPVRSLLRFPKRGPFGLPRAYCSRQAFMLSLVSAAASGGWGSTSRRARVGARRPCDAARRRRWSG